MTRLTLAAADRIIEEAFAERRRRSFAPLTVAVLDAGGHIVALKREDNSGILRNDIAFAKAWGALGMGLSSREIGERAAKGPTFYGSLYAVSQGRLIPGPGGVLVHDEGGGVIGAVGISGDTGDNDEVCALVGIAAAGLKSTPTKAGA